MVDVTKGLLTWSGHYGGRNGSEQSGLCSNTVDCVFHDLRCGVVRHVADTLQNRQIGLRNSAVERDGMDVERYGGVLIAMDDFKRHGKLSGVAGGHLNNMGAEGIHLPCVGPQAVGAHGQGRADVVDVAVWHRLRRKDAFYGVFDPLIRGKGFGVLQTSGSFDESVMRAGETVGTVHSDGFVVRGRRRRRGRIR